MRQFSGGDFIWSLTFTDIFCQWTQNRAIWNKGAHGVLQQVKDLEAGLPFELLGFDVHNGSEFLTGHLWRYLLDRPRPVPLTRSRPYRKNDQAHVRDPHPTIGIGTLEEHRSHDHELRKGLDKLSVPKIAINSNARPSTVGAQRNGVHVTRMPTVGHFVMLEDPRRFNNLLDKPVRSWIQAQAIRRVA